MREAKRSRETDPTPLASTGLSDDPPAPDPDDTLSGHDNPIAGTSGLLSLGPSVRTGSGDTSGESESESDSDTENEWGSGESSEDDTEFDGDKAQEVIDEWVVSLSALDRKMLAVGLMLNYGRRQGMNVMDSAQEAASFTGLNEKTVRMYKKSFFENKGKFEETKQGKYRRKCLINDESLRLEAAMFVRQNSYKKGAANLTAKSFCEWVNNDLLPNNALAANLPRKISVSTATRWLHRLGFRQRSHKKGSYVDGHEREDVVKHRDEFLKELAALKKTHLPPPPCSDERAHTPPPNAEYMKKLVLIYHDESIFNVNEGQPWMWATDDMPVLQPKTKGAGIMVSDFIDQYSGYLRLSDEEHAVATAHTPNFPKSSRALLEHGAAKEGYWTSEKFMKNVEVACQIAEYKYSKEKHDLVWLFDQSSCHKAFAEDALNAKAMNVKPGSVQPRMRDTVWAGRPQKMVMPDDTPKGMKAVLEEREINTATLKKDDMTIILSNHDDFKNEKTLVEHFLINKGHKVLFIPKFHCEFNP